MLERRLSATYRGIKPIASDEFNVEVNQDKNPIITSKYYNQFGKSAIINQEGPNLG